MAGGIWVKQNKIRPGAYINFEAKRKMRDLFGDIGRVALPVALNWGAENKIIEIEPGQQEQKTIEDFGYSLDDDEMLLIRECLHSAHKVLVYRVSGGTKAELTVINLTVKAKYAGTRGNAIQVQASVNADDNDAVDFKVFLGGMIKETQIGVKLIEELQESKYVDFDGTGSIPVIPEAGGSLVGGTDVDATVADYQKAFDAFSFAYFECLGICSDDSSVKKLAVSFTKQMIEQKGKYIQTILSDYDADNEFITSIDSGVILYDGTVIDRLKAVAWYAGASAAAGPAGSLTYAVYPNAVKVDDALTDYEIEQKIVQGKVVFSPQIDNDGNDIIVVEDDVNTLQTYTTQKPKDWNSNRVIRAMNQFANDVYMFWHRSYIGKISNNVSGRNLLKADITTNIRAREDQGVFEEKAFDPEYDLKVEQGDTKDAVIVEVNIQPVDAMEKLYMTVFVA